MWVTTEEWEEHKEDIKRLYRELGRLNRGLKYLCPHERWKPLGSENFVCATCGDIVSDVEEIPKNARIEIGQSKTISIKQLKKLLKKLE